MMAGVLENLLTALLEDCSKSFIANIWNVNDNFNTLRDTLHEKLKELQETLIGIHAQGYSLSCTPLPSDWLDQLVWCHYEIEDTTDSINLAVSNQTLTTKILQTHLKRIRRLHNELQAMETKLSLKISPEQQQSTSATRGGGSGRVSVSPALEFLRVRDKEAIIRELKSHTIGVSILGIGGTGKTKLAEAIVEDASIKDHFPCILSPPVSPNFSLRNALECVNGSIRGENTRVLIKLDGVQSVSPEDWHQFQSHCLQKLPCKVLITTQNPKVADATGCAKYVLGCLSPAECFSLICDRAQGNKNLCEVDVVAINHNEVELVEKCKGLPLLANQIGLLLSAAAPGSRDKIVGAITTNSIWKQSGMQRVLHDLWPVSMLARKQHLQRCVSYCSLFPPKHEFIRDDLVQLWMMEGFIQATSTTEDACFLEQAASDCFDDLLTHSIFQASDDDDDDQEEKSTYKMHQLLYDLAQNLGSKTLCRIHEPDFSVSPYIRHLSLSCEKAIPLLLNDVGKCKGLRTFLLLDRAGEKITKNPTFYETLERLRVLDLSHTNLTKLARMSKLKHLRYLNLSHTPIKTLSPLSKNHPALLVLKLNVCDLLQSLPNDLSELTNLVSLQVNMKNLGVMPRNIGRLSKLQTLNVFIVGKEEGCKITELKNMNQIRESLCITKLENVETVSDAQEAMLQKKNRLERLELQWTTCKTSSESAKQVLEGLVPHKNLKELTIRRYNGFQFPQWLSTPQICGMLKTIHLVNCETCTALPSLGQLPMLRTLCLETMKKVTRLSNEFFSGGFLCLESLKLCELPDLTEWTELTVGCMPRLRELQIVNCQRLVKLPPLDSLSSLESLEFHECPLLQELPTLPTSMKTLIITESDILGKRCQVEHLDGNKIRGMNVLIDSEKLDTGVQSLLSAPDHEAVVQQTNCLQVGGQQPSICLRLINQESDIIQEGSWQHQIPKSQGQSEIQTAKRIRLTSNTTMTSKTSN